MLLYSNHIILFLLMITISAYQNICGSLFHISSQSIQKNNATAIISVEASDQKRIYADRIHISTNHPNVTVTSWKPSKEALPLYDPYLHDAVPQYNTPFSITCTIGTADVLPNDSALVVGFYNAHSRQVEQTILPLAIPSTKPSTPTSEQTAPYNSTNNNDNIIQKEPIKLDHSRLQQPLSCYIADSIKATESFPLRVLMAFLLGLLLSLTPCIYPMIPITIGILQAHRGSSLLRNFALSAAYSFGISLTFATLGLAAAYSGYLFGSIMNKPLFIFTIVALLLYLALSMIGLYDMYTPRFLQPKSTKNSGGSLFSAFIIGAASGTVASPCLSPGLLLLLTIVATYKSLLAGFILLFTFGIGLSTPLLIIGTASSSLTILPRAGIWMVHVKRLLGFLMLAVCLMFLRNIFSYHIIAWISVLLAILCGLFYLHSAQKPQSREWQWIEWCIGVLCITLSIPLATHAYHSTFIKDQGVDQSFWHSAFDAATNIARHEKKPLFIYITAGYCSICKAIEKKLFSLQTVQQVLSERTVPIKVDGCDDESTIELLQKYHSISGVPTYLIIDAETYRVIHSWGAELYDIDPHSFINTIKQL